MLDEGTLSWNARYELELDVIKRRHSPVCTEIMMKGYRCMKSELLEKVRPFEERSERERTPSALGLGARSWVIRGRYPALYGNQTYPKYAYKRVQILELLVSYVLFPKFFVAK
ncbi:unnamed protein product [Laminaria digitata]